MSPEFLRLVSDNEQDRMECRRWWHQASTADKMLVWHVIQRHYEDPAMEIMARFAQLAFGEMAEQEERAR